MTGNTTGRRPISRWARTALVAAVATVGSLMAAGGRTSADERHRNELTFEDPAGLQRRITTADSFDEHNPFFQSIGTNGRSCVTCHRPAEGWSITPQEVRERFEATRGLDPIFRNTDGSNCEGADLSTFRKRRKAFSALLGKGVIRVGMTVPDNAEFEIVDVDDPYHCGALFTGASLYRRPLPSTNLGVLSTVMWDGRETAAGQSIEAESAVAGVRRDDGPCAGRAALGRRRAADRRLRDEAAHGADPGSSRRQPSRRWRAWRTAVAVASAVLHRDQRSARHAAGDAWSMRHAVDRAGHERLHDVPSWDDAHSRERRAIARGEQLFDSRTFVIDGVAGLNGDPAIP